MSNEKTHYRKAFNSPYLSSADIVGPTILTVKHVVLSGDATKKTKESFNTAHFVEKELRPGEILKPMILNATNSKVMRDLAGSHYIEDWKNIPVQIYVDTNVKFGRETMEGLRISPERVQKALPVLVRDSKQWYSAIDAYIRDGNLNAVLKRASISDEDQNELIAQANAKKASVSE